MGTQAALTLTRDFEQLQCAACGIDFWVPGHWCDVRRRNHEGWYCPNGHRLVFKGESDIEKALRGERQARESLEWERKRIAKLERESKKLKRRIATGVCPCCHRTFGNLAAHMKGEHPDFAPRPDAKVA